MITVSLTVRVTGEYGIILEDVIETEMKKSFSL